MIGNSSFLSKTVKMRSQGWLAIHIYIDRLEYLTGGFGIIGGQNLRPAMRARAHAQGCALPHAQACARTLVRACARAHVHTRTRVPACAWARMAWPPAFGPIGPKRPVGPIGPCGLIRRIGPTAHIRSPYTHTCSRSNAHICNDSTTFVIILTPTFVVICPHVFVIVFVAAFVAIL